MPVKLSVAVMAHKRRKHFVAAMTEQLEDPTVVWDSQNDRWDTGRRSMLAYDNGATWHLVVQDDALLCKDFLAGVRAALSCVGPERPVSFYTGKVRPHGPAIAQAVEKARGIGTPWLAMDGPLWGPSIAVPVQMIDQMVAQCDRMNIENYDLRIARHFMGLGIDCWYSLPSLVDHRTGAHNPSLVQGRSSDAARTAHTFIGGQSPLQINWNTAALQVNLRRGPNSQRSVTHMNRTRNNGRVTIATRRTYGYDRHGRRVLVAAPGHPLPPGFDLDAERKPAKATTKTAPAPSVDYSQLKQPELKALLDQRSIEYPNGPVRNAHLVELLVAADA